MTPERIIQQRQIAEILYNFYFQDDVETSMLMESDRKITTSGLGIGLTMNEWIPIIRAVMTAIAIGVIPFLVLFLPTPIVGKAASVMLGFFVFLSTWGVTDAVIHGAAMDYAAELLAGSGYTVDAGFHVSYAMIIMGILILFAAEVFAIGQNLSEEQKLTI